jgi:hypothetical protein
MAPISPMLKECDAGRFLPEPAGRVYISKILTGALPQENPRSNAHEKKNKDKEINSNRGNEIILKPGEKEASSVVTVAEIDEEKATNTRIATVDTGSTPTIPESVTRRIERGPEPTSKKRNNWCLRWDSNPRRNGCPFERF